PLLAASPGFNQPLRINFEGSRVHVFDVSGHTFDRHHRTVKVFEVVNHDFVPQAASLQIFHEVRVQNREVAGEVRLDIEVLERRLNGRADTNDIGYGGSRSN